MNRDPSKSIGQSLYLSQNIPLKESQDPAECPICLQTVKVRGKISCCNHIFCYTCIFEWSKITNSCPLCKVDFHEIEKCDVNGKPCRGDSKPHVIHVEDKEQENNDVIVQEFIYDDCPFLNEYIEDDFLVSDDAPILYETQVTATSSLVNIPHYDSSSKESIPLSLESDSTPPRPRRRRQVILSQSQQLDHLILRRRRRPVIVSDEEEETPCLFPELLAPATPIRRLPSLSLTQSYQQDSILPSEPSATATPVLISRLPTVELSEQEEKPERRCFSDSMVCGLSIIPETPVRGLKSERRCRSESDRFLREKMSHMI